MTDHLAFFSILEQHLEPFSGNLAPQLVDIELLKLNTDREHFKIDADTPPLLDHLAMALNMIVGPEMSKITLQRIRNSLEPLIPHS